MMLLFLMMRFLSSIQVKFPSSQGNRSSKSFCPNGHSHALLRSFFPPPLLLAPPVLPTLNAHCSANTTLFSVILFVVKISFNKFSNKSKIIENDEGTSTQHAVEDNQSSFQRVPQTKILQILRQRGNPRGRGQCR